MNGQDENQSSADWELYLEVFLDESDEDLESLTDALLRLEENPEDKDSLNEAFRLLHTHKGSAGLMGFEEVSELAHQLENRFEAYRSGKEKLDPSWATLLFRCVDYLKEFNAALRSGSSPPNNARELLEQLANVDSADNVPGEESAELSTSLNSKLSNVEGGYRIIVEFEEGLQLADMKARLIVARLENVGEIVATEPAVDDIQSVDQLRQFSLVILTERPIEEVRSIADVDGVKSIVLEGQDEEKHAEESLDQTLALPPKTDSSGEVKKASNESHETNKVEQPPADPAAGEMQDNSNLEETQEFSVDKLANQSPKQNSESKSDTRNTASTQVGETVRVGIDRLDKLMNLTGELIVKKARLSQLIKELVYECRSTIAGQQESDIGGQLRARLSRLRDAFSGSNNTGEPAEWVDKFSADIDQLEIEFEKWEQFQRNVSQVAESAEQLDRVSDNLQESVLDTRMVPVAPLFNRFRRVVRDLADDRKQQIRLEIQGENTELDKRMIDELGDPLLHLIRNSIDHGIESPDVRTRNGKDSVGNILLNASQRGNHVFITISDDGQGIDFDKIKKRIVERGLASEAQVAEFNDKQLTDYIWQPGFSTSQSVTDISGRGVGMDVVKSRIGELNGVVEVDSTKNQGTVFTLRLPLTLAIIRSLLVRIRDVHFSIPISDVLETVAVSPSQTQTAYGRELIDLRGMIIPLVRTEDVFDWNHPDCDVPKDEFAAPDSMKVVIIQTQGQTIGLVVDELFGSSDIVIKSLADNFVPIRGLSGASIMGDGTVNLMIDPNEIIRMTANRGV